MDVYGSLLSISSSLLPTTIIYYYYSFYFWGQDGRRRFACLLETCLHLWCVEMERKRNLCINY